MGQRVHVIERSLSGGRLRATMWAAPSLGCYALRSTVEYSLLGENRVVSLQLGTPDPTLFEVPSTYEELPPSQFKLRRDGALPAAETARNKLKDDVYYTGETQQPVR
ncbi:MAG: hypothetical protein ACKV22_39955 [Bryobacteraceae bacterium]